MRISNISNLAALGAMTRGAPGTPPEPPATPKTPKKPTLAVGGRTGTPGSATRSGTSTFATSAADGKAAETKATPSTKVVRQSASAMQSAAQGEVRAAAAKEGQLTLRVQNGDTSFTTAMALAEAQAKSAAAAERALAVKLASEQAARDGQAVAPTVATTKVPDASTSMQETNSGYISVQATLPPGYVAPKYESGGGGGGSSDGEQVKLVEAAPPGTAPAAAQKAGSSHDSTVPGWVKYGGGALAAVALGYVAYKRLKKI